MSGPPVFVTGCVTARRKCGPLLFLTLLRLRGEVDCVSDDETISELNVVSEHVQVVLQRADPGAGLLLLGTKVQMEGVFEEPGKAASKAACKKSSSGVNGAETFKKVVLPTIHCKRWTVLKVSADAGLKGVERLLDAPRDAVPVISVARALSCPLLEAEELVALPAGSEERKQRVVRINRRLKGLPEQRHRVRPPHITRGDKALLDAVDKCLQVGWEIKEQQTVCELEFCDDDSLTLTQDKQGHTRTFSAKSGGGNNTRAERKRRRKDSKFKELSSTEFATILAKAKQQELVHINNGNLQQSQLKKLAFSPLDSLSHSDLADDDYVAYCITRKTPQMLWMLDRLEGVVQLDNSRNTLIIDIGCGRGDLTLNIAAALPSCRIVGLDINAMSLQVGEERAKTAGLSNLTFCETSAETLLDRERFPVVLDAIWLQMVERPQDSKVVFVGLHACGGLSDVLLALVAKYQAYALCCTCCFGKHVQLRRNACSEAVGHDWSWWGQVPEVGKRLAELCESHAAEQTYVRAMQLVNSLRVQWVRNALAKKSHTEGRTHAFKLLCFSPSLSPKNQVICIFPLS